MKKEVFIDRVEFTFKDLPTIICKRELVSAENQDKAVMFGLGHKIGDAAAIPKSEANGFTVTEQMRYDAVLEQVGHLESGTTDWNLKGGTRAVKQNPTFAAIAAKKGITYAEAEAMVADLMLSEV